MLAIQGVDLIRVLYWRVGFGHAKHEEKGAFRVASGKPRNALFREQIGGESVLRRQRISVAIQIIGVLVGRRLKSVMTVEVVKPLIGGLGFAL